MPVDMFLKLDDIKGESQDAKHKDEIEVLSWNWGVNQGGTSHSGTGGGSGKVSVRDISIVKYVDKASPNLLKWCCNGKHFQKASLVVRKAGGNALEYLKLELKDGLISGVNLSVGQSDERLTETVTLNFASFKYEYIPQTGTGAGGGAIPAQWNIARNAES
jgi:type VI secretion system secreted protein Hcp